MVTLILQVEKNEITITARETLVSGSVNVFPVRFVFSDDWAGLEKTAVFRAGEERFYIPLGASEECKIPSAVLKKSGRTLFAGVYGTRGETLVLPTVWVDCGRIAKGVDTAAPGPAEGTGNLSSDDIDRIVVLDWMEYEAIRVKDPRTLYLLRG